MSVVLTFLALTGIVALSVLFRLRWPRLTTPARRRLLILFALALLPILLNLCSRWETTSPAVNESLGWGRIGAYELCIVMFTLLHPRVLTTLIAVILTLPIFSSAIVGPLSESFRPAHATIHPIAGGYYLETRPWASGPHDNTGTDFSLFYRPAHVALFRRPFLGMRLYDTQCRTGSLFATLDTANAHILVHCPPLAAETTPAPGTDLLFIIPPGARSPQLKHIPYR